MIENLLDNALRHTPEHGTVKIAWQEPGSSASIPVTDTGSGIAEGDLPHLFEPLSRGESSRNRQTGGAGLGLTIARRIMEAHGGILEAANTPSSGAVFTATLPKIVIPVYTRSRGMTMRGSGGFEVVVLPTRFLEADR